jgi:hypothetical protein
MMYDERLILISLISMICYVLCFLVVILGDDVVSVHIEFHLLLLI